MGGAAAIEVAMLLGSMAVKEGSEFEAMQEKKRALEQLRTQEELKGTQEGIQRENKLEKILGTQRAEGAARGVAPTSASMGAISRGTFDAFAEDETAANLNLRIKESEIDTEKENASRKFMFQSFGNLFDAANKFSNLKVPASPGTPSGSEVDGVMQNYTISGQHPSDLTKGSAGPLDLSEWNKEQNNKFIGF